jgi:hypothetical protein
MSQLDENTLYQLLKELSKEEIQELTEHPEFIFDVLEAYNGGDSEDEISEVTQSEYDGKYILFYYFNLLDKMDVNESISSESNNMEQMLFGDKAKKSKQPEIDTIGTFKI